MTVPVLSSFARSFPDNRISLLSNKRLESLFTGMPNNFDFIGVDLKSDYSGIGGIFRLFALLRKRDFRMVADFHGVVRSGILSVLFFITGVRVVSIRKGRIDRWRVTRRWQKRNLELKPIYCRYNNVLNRLGFSVKLNFQSVFGDEKGDFNRIKNFTGERGYKRWIGIAPFAAHIGKIYPINMMERVVATLAELEDTVLYVFAYGAESEKVEGWRNLSESVILVNGQLSMIEELILISHLNVMLAMDSSNSHLASLTGIPVVSVWGATHPSLGFLGYNQTLDNCAQSKIDCRPCSAFGKKPCIYNDYRCLSDISPKMIVDMVKRYL